jgi:hypothetical protein
MHRAEVERLSARLHDPGDLWPLVSSWSSCWTRTARSTSRQRLRPELGAGAAREVTDDAPAGERMRGVTGR